MIVSNCKTSIFLLNLKLRIHITHMKLKAYVLSITKFKFITVQIPDF